MRRGKIALHLLIMMAGLAFLSACGGGGDDSSYADKSVFENEAGWLNDPEIRNILMTSAEGSSENGTLEFTDTDDIAFLDVDEENGSDEQKAASRKNSDWSLMHGYMKITNDAWVGLQKSGLGWFVKATGVSEISSKEEDKYLTGLAKSLAALDRIEKGMEAANTKIEKFTDKFNKLTKKTSEAAALSTWASILTTSDTYGLVSGNFEARYNLFYNNLNLENKPELSLKEIVERIATDPNLDEDYFFSLSNNSLLFKANESLHSFVGGQNDTLNLWKSLGTSVSIGVDAAMNEQDTNLIETYYSYGSCLGKMAVQAMSRLQKAYNVFALAIVLNAYHKDKFDFGWQNSVNVPKKIFGGEGGSTKAIKFPIYNVDYTNTVDFDEEKAIAAIESALKKLAHNFDEVYMKDFRARIKAFKYYNGDVIRFLQSRDFFTLKFSPKFNQDLCQPLVYVRNYSGDKRTDYLALDYVVDVENEKVETLQLFIPHAKDESERQIAEKSLFALNDITYEKGLGLSGTLNRNILSCSPGFFDHEPAKTTDFGDKNDNLIRVKIHGLLGFPQVYGETRDGAYFGSEFTGQEWGCGCDQPAAPLMNATFFSDTRASEALANHSNSKGKSSEHWYALTPSGHVAVVEIRQTQEGWYHGGFYFEGYRWGTYGVSVLGTGEGWKVGSGVLTFNDGASVQLGDLSFISSAECACPDGSFGGFHNNIGADLRVRSDGSRPVSTNFRIDNNGTVLERWEFPDLDFWDGYEKHKMELVILHKTKTYGNKYYATEGYVIIDGSKIDINSASIEYKENGDLYSSICFTSDRNIAYTVSIHGTYTKINLSSGGFKLRFNGKAYIKDSNYMQTTAPYVEGTGVPVLITK